MNEANTLKELKTAFVSGHSGTSRSEIVLVCLSAPIGTFLYLELKKLMYNRHVINANNQDRRNRDWMKHALVETFVILLPMAICQTKLIYPWGLLLLILELALAIILNVLSSSKELSNGKHHSKYSIVTKKKDTKLSYPFLTSYRSTISYITFVAILAVDFHVFPRRFAKTEVIGYGLMDLGASSFIVSAGFVSRYARRKIISNPLAQDSKSKDLNINMTSWLRVNEIVPVIYHSLPLIIIGFVRLLLSKGVDYQEHVSEYGIHWNFFFTLSIVGIFTSILHSIIDSVMLILSSVIGINTYTPNHKESISFSQKIKCNMVSFAPSLVTLTFYQICLSFFGLQDYIENAPRLCTHESCNIFASNREGILGCISYTALYCLSEEISSICLWDPCMKLGDELQSVITTNAGKEDEINSVGLKKKRISQTTHEQHFLYQRQQTKNNSTAHEQTNNPNEVNYSSSKTDNEPQSSTEPGKRLFFFLLLLMSFEYYLTEILHVPPSRRSTNAPFVIWSLEFNVLSLLITWITFHIAELNQKHHPSLPSPILKAVNRNGLLVFLSANLMTGIVNLSINTLNVSDMKALAVILCYLCGVGIIALVFDKGLNISLKL